jgi:hypothetical protein
MIHISLQKGKYPRKRNFNNLEREILPFSGEEHFHGRCS